MTQERAPILKSQFHAALPTDMVANMQLRAAEFGIPIVSLLEAYITVGLAKVSGDLARSMHARRGDARRLSRTPGVSADGERVRAGLTTLCDSSTAVWFDLSTIAKASGMSPAHTLRALHALVPLGITRNRTVDEGQVDPWSGEVQIVNQYGHLKYSTWALVERVTAWERTRAAAAAAARGDL